MNEVALRFFIIVLAISFLSVAFAFLSGEMLVKKTRDMVAWLLKTAYFDLIQMFIFVRPWKKYVEQIGIFIWLVLVLIIIRYMVVTQPSIADIPGPYIPLIGYVYFLSVLFIVWIVIRSVRRSD